MTAPASFLRGYDPDAMAWTTVSTSEDRNSAPVPTFRHQSLNDAVARRSLVQAKTAASVAAPASGTPAGKTQPPASRAAGSKRKALTNWKPRPFPKPGLDDFVVVLKPREHVSPHQAFSENRYGAAITAYLGPEVARSVTVLPSREQNLILIHTPNPAAADRLLGDFSINTERGAIPLHGYLRQDGGDICHGVIVVSNSDTTESLREQVQWRAGTIVEVRKFGSSNKARVTFAGREKPRFVHYENMLIPVQTYYRTIPACGLCGVVGHRADACPNTQQNTCGLCGQQAPLVEGVRAPHECVPRCSVFGGGHATNSRECAAKFRTHKMAAPKGGTKKKMAAKKKSRHLGLPGESPSRDDCNTEKPAPHTGGAGKRPPTQPPPHGGTGKLSTLPPRGDARAWANAVKHGTQVSGTGRAASASPTSSPPAARSAEQAQIAALECQIEMLLKKITLLESQLKQPTTPPSTPATEAMESEPAAPNAALSAEAALEARLEARIDARFNTLESQISAAITSAIAKITENIPTIVAQHIAQSSRGVRRTGSFIKDVCPKTSRRNIETEAEDNDSCSLSGMEDAPLPASAGSGAASLQLVFPFNDHGGQPSN
ncbi:uncharacterized protein [Dermacentor andersoni]|uniref:uncharacterized protein n=1 Tax=Dermacentor andersoni TaxID=34620 RepID=UPI002155317D|nr:uncharacterized protein LOC126532219 [Dermacentor andersoni]